MGFVTHKIESFLRYEVTPWRAGSTLRQKRYLTVWPNSNQFLRVSKNICDLALS